MQLAARIAVSNLHKNTKKSFSETVKDMYRHVNARSGLKSPLIDDDVYDLIIKVAITINGKVMSALCSQFVFLHLFLSFPAHGLNLCLIRLQFGY